MGEIKSEEDLQGAFFAWLKGYDENIWDITYHCPNGGFRHIWEAKKLKILGLKPGVPDIFVPVPSRGFHGLYIELKFGFGKPSAAQINFMHKLTKQGYVCRVCYTLETTIQVLLNYLGIEDYVRYYPIQESHSEASPGCLRALQPGFRRDSGRNLRARKSRRNVHLPEGWSGQGYLSDGAKDP